MSQDERDAIIGKTGRLYQAETKRRACLKTKISSIADALKIVQEALDGCFDSDSDYEYSDKKRLIQRRYGGRQVELPASEELHQVFLDVAATERRIEELRQHPRKRFR